MIYRSLRILHPRGVQIIIGCAEHLREDDALGDAGALLVSPGLAAGNARPTSLWATRPTNVVAFELQL